MKKILLSLAVVASLSAVSCSQAEKAKDEAGDFKTKIENCTNPDSLKIYIEQAVAYADSLRAGGKDTEAADYLNDIQATVTAKDPAMVTYFDKAMNRLDAAVKADSVAAAAKDAAKEVADSAVSKANDVKEKAVDAAKDAKDKAVSAASDAADKAKSAASDAADKAKGLLK